MGRGGPDTGRVALFGKDVRFGIRSARRGVRVGPLRRLMCGPTSTKARLGRVRGVR